MKKIYLIIVLLTFITSCATKNTELKSQHKYSPYYFFADTTVPYKEIGGKQLYDFISFDGLAWKGSYLNNKKMIKQDLDNIKENRNLNGIKRKMRLQYGFTRERTNMRLYPTSDTIHRGNVKFDANQYSSISPFTPLYIAHISKDGKFYYCLTDFLRGWIEVDKINIYGTDDFIKIQKMDHLRVVKDHTSIGNVVYGIGDKVPLIAKGITRAAVLSPENKKVVVPLDNSKYLVGDAIFSEKYIKSIAESVMDNPYDWGGKEGRRDCSSYVRDLWRVFGANIPRSTGTQNLVGKTLLFKPKKAEDFYTVLDEAKPFKTLIFFKGHVILYAGKENNDYVIYHAVSKLKNDDGDIVDFYKVTRNELKKEGFLNIWQRVVKVVEISPLISPKLPYVPEISTLNSLENEIIKYESATKSTQDK